MPLSPLRTPTRGPRSRSSSSLLLPLLGGLALAGLAYGLWTLAFGQGRRIKAAVELARQGQAEEALARLGALGPAEDPRILDAQGLAKARLGQEKEAAELYAQARAKGLKPAAVDLHLEEGQGYLATGKLELAKAEYLHARALDPKDARAAAGQAACAHALGELAEALRLYKEALALDPGSKEASEGSRKAHESLDRGTLYYLFDRNGEPLARRAVSEQGLGERSYPLAQTAAHVVGALSEKAGDQGLERDLKALLPAAEVSLTLDARMQEAASKALGWRKGALVAVDPRTGEILAALSQPSYKPANLNKEWRELRDNRNRPLLNRAFDGLYEPGSIAKIITAAGALEAKVDMSKIFPMKAATAITLDGKVFRDWEDHGKVRSLKEAMDVSSNVALYHVGKALGADRLYAITNRFGFNKPFDLGFRLPDGRSFEVRAASPRAPMHPDTQYALAERACGLGTDYRTTPLHAAFLAATIANGGRRMQPRLIKEVRTLSGQTLYSMKPELAEEVVSAEVAQKVKEMMLDAVEGHRGIGKRAKVEGVRIAGKTGTSRTHKKGQLDAWFICFAPVEKPQIAVAVFCDQEGTGMHVAAPIAGAFIGNVLK